MSIDEQNGDLLSKYRTLSEHKQLELDFFSNGIIVAPEIKSKGKDATRYQPLEIIKFPFFLQTRSDVVAKSREGFKAYKLNENLKKKGLSRSERDKLTNYNTGPNVLEKEYKNWKITAHQNYGLPDSFDGFVWEVIISIVSDHLQKGELYSFYPITPNRIESELIERGVLTSRSGINYNRIKYSINRLKNTKYEYSKGVYIKKSDEYVSFENYDFSLISATYERGEYVVDSNGSKTFMKKFSIAIDPAMSENLANNHYLILLNKRRVLLKEYESITLFDKLSYLAYQDVKNGNFYISQKAGMRYSRKISYEKVCEWLGIEKKDKNSKDYKKSIVIRQLNQYHKELIKIGVIDEIIIQDFGGRKGMRFHFIYIFKAEFLMEMIKLQSKMIQSQEKLFTSHEVKNYIGTVQRMINDLDIVKKLFY